MILKLSKYWKYIYVVYLVAILSTQVLAAGSTLGGGGRLILLLQKASFWVGLGVTIWGIVEMQLDYPGWKSRVMKGVLGYIAILLLPLIFLELRNALQVDVWDTIENEYTGLDN